MTPSHDRRLFYAEYYGIHHLKVAITREKCMDQILGRFSYVEVEKWLRFRRL